jgi:hypothetical protein
MKRTILTITAAVSVAASAFGQDAPSSGAASRQDQRVASLRERGQAITQRAFKLLSSNLMQAVAEGGVTNALSFCSTRALPLTHSVVEGEPVVLRRVSHKARNPKNKADASELMILQAFSEKLAAGEKPSPIVRTHANGAATYFAPIPLNNPLCLNCHGVPGKEIKPEALKLLKKLYPKDEATGFKFGELRGMWRVDFKPTSATRRE